MSGTALEVSGTALEVSRAALEVSRTALEVSRTALEVSGAALEVSRAALEEVAWPGGAQSADMSARPHMGCLWQTKTRSPWRKRSL